MTSVMFIVYNNIKKDKTMWLTPLKINPITPNTIKSIDSIFKTLFIISDKIYKSYIDKKLFFLYY